MSSFSRKIKAPPPGLLLSLLHIVRRDPNATVVVLPSDHFVRQEDVLARGLQQAARLARIDHQHVYLLGPGARLRSIRN